MQGKKPRQIRSNGEREKILKVKIDEIEIENKTEATEKAKEIFRLEGFSVVIWISLPLFPIFPRKQLNTPKNTGKLCK